jgi:hypothetical protein
MDWADPPASGAGSWWTSAGSGGGGATQRFGFSAFGKEAAAVETAIGLVAAGWRSGGLMWFAACLIGVDSVPGFRIRTVLENKGIP